MTSLRMQSPRSSARIARALVTFILVVGFASDLGSTAQGAPSPPPDKKSVAPWYVGDEHKPPKPLGAAPFRPSFADPAPVSGRMREKQAAFLAEAAALRIKHAAATAALRVPRSQGRAPRRGF